MLESNNHLMDSQSPFKLWLSVLEIYFFDTVGFTLYLSATGNSCIGESISILKSTYFLDNAWKTQHDFKCSALFVSTVGEPGSQPG